ncbi:hypothetical protein [Enhygromyxa salina]|uniref:hypothetical protein n=1 Tax=Enhygromyxa salina TaxID=215803 RepID=UPI000D089D7A|nr:hypothetical protein [Enhygromyxa salina]
MLFAAGPLARAWPGVLTAALSQLTPIGSLAPQLETCVKLSDISSSAQKVFQSSQSACAR